MKKIKRWKYFLTFAINSIIFKTYDKINRFSTNRANQYDTNTLKSVFIKCPGDFRAYDQIWFVQTTSLSLCPGSSTNRAGITNSRAEDCFYGQASSKLNTADQRKSSEDRAINQQLNNPCARAFSQQWRGLWLRNSITEKCNWNISMIVCQIRNWPRSIEFWLWIRSGLTIPWQPMKLIQEIK